MLCLSSFELYSRWVPLIYILISLLSYFALCGHGPASMITQQKSKLDRRVYAKKGKNSQLKTLYTHYHDND